MPAFRHPFIDKGNGMPTLESAQDALVVVGLGRLANVQVGFGQLQGSMTEMISECRIDRLTQNWPTDFIQTVIAAAAQVGQ